MVKEKRPARRGPAVRAHSTDVLGANSEIARKLGEYYDGLVSDEIPDRFVELLMQLEKAQTPAKKD